MSMKPGIYEGLANTAYHADGALGSTQLKTLALSTPAHFKHQQAHRKIVPAFDFGSALHSYVLEDDVDASLVIDAGARRGKVWEAGEAEARATDRYPVLTAEWEAIKGMREAVMADPLARKVFTGHKAETSYFWEEGGQMLKARTDAEKPGLIGDLKSCQSADPNEFQRTAYKLGYFISAAHYRAGRLALTGEKSAFVFVNVEKTYPFHVSVVELDDEALEYGEQMLIRAKRIFAECAETGNWPGYPATTIGLPKWAMNQLEELINND